MSKDKLCAVCNREIEDPQSAPLCDTCNAAGWRYCPKCAKSISPEEIARRNEPLEKFRVLNLGAGSEFLPSNLRSFLDSYEDLQIICVDLSYGSPNALELEVPKYVKLVSKDIVTYLQQTTIKFDYVICYRVLEHISFRELDFLLYLISKVCNNNAILDIIVPNHIELYKKLMYLDENFERLSPLEFMRTYITLTTEIYPHDGSPLDMHKSIWTPSLIRYYVELENHFQVQSIDPHFSFDNKDIYLRCIAQRKEER